LIRPIIVYLLIGRIVWVALIGFMVLVSTVQFLISSLLKEMPL